MYGYYNQQDSNECFLFLLDIFEEESKKLDINPNHPFLGFYVYETNCRHCNLTEYFFEKNCLMMLDLQKDDEYQNIKNQLVQERISWKQQNGQFYKIENKAIAPHKNVDQSKYDVQNGQLFINIGH